MAEGSGLLNRQRVKLLVGSNPTSSANTKTQTKFRLCLGFVVFARGCGIRTTKPGTLWAGESCPAAPARL